MITRLISGLINSALAADPDTAQKLAVYDSKKIRVNFIPINISIIIFITAKKIKIYKINLNNQQNNLDITTEITGTPLDLAAIIYDKNNNNNLNNIIISGDLLFLHELTKIFSSLDVDIEKKLSYFIGDTGAYTFMQGASSVAHSVSAKRKNFFTHIKEYIEDEQRWIVSRLETQDFCHDIDILRHAVDRLEAKISFLTENGEK